MQGEIILTGTELITGQVAEVNARYAARRLHESGLEVLCITTLGDGAPLFGELLQRALGRSRFIIITGGLGPTDDDLTVAQAAAALNLELVQDEAMVGRIKRRLEERGFVWEPGCGKMALIPEGATVLDTGRSACGFSLQHQDVWLFFLPGIPGEMHRLFESGVLPVLLGLVDRPVRVVQRYLRVFGKMEVEVQQAVAAVEQDVAGIEVGYYPNFPEVHLSLTARGPERALLEARLERGVAALSRELGDVLMGLDGAPLEEVVGRLLRQQGKTLAVAESCSGGLICHRLTDISGSSDYFQGGSGDLQQPGQDGPPGGTAHYSRAARRRQSRHRPGHGPGGAETFSCRLWPRGDGHCRAHRGHPGKARGPGVYGAGHPRWGGNPPAPVPRGPGEGEGPDGRNRPGLAAPGAAAALIIHQGLYPLPGRVTGDAVFAQINRGWRDINNSLIICYNSIISGRVVPAHSGAREFAGGAALASPCP